MINLSLKLTMRSMWSVAVEGSRDSPEEVLPEEVERRFEQHLEQSKSLYKIRSDGGLSMRSDV